MIKNKLKNFKIVLGYKSLIVISIFLAGIGTGVAFASIPDSSGQISTCYRNTLLQKTFRVIDSETGQTCAANETALNFNQTGPQGEPGPAGPQGPKGDPGPKLVRATASKAVPVTGGTVDLAAQCPQDKVYTAVAANWFFLGNTNGIVYPIDAQTSGIQSYNPADIPTINQGPRYYDSWDIRLKYEDLSALVPSGFSASVVFVVVVVCQANN